MTNGPVLIDLEGRDEVPSPAEAPPVPEPVPPEGTSATTRVMSGIGARRPSRLARLFWGSLGALLAAWLSLAAWDFVAGLLARNLWLGRGVLLLLAVFLLAAAAMILKEWLALARLRRIDRLRRALDAAGDAPLGEARRAVDRLAGFYRGRADMAWGLATLAERRDDILDSPALLALAERALMEPLDRAAGKEIEAAARQVATVTALVPLALADVAAALLANIRMIRRIAEIYGGRAGFFGAWRLFRAVMVHLVATGAVAIGDDLIHSVAGGGLLSKLSRRFGEGVINGALTARVGVAAMDVCRPMPFRGLSRPKVSGLVTRALGGLFAKT